jgi:hypothetical protein
MRAFAAVPRLDLRAGQIQYHACRQQIVRRQHRMHTGGRPRVIRVDPRQHAMPDLSTHKHSKQRARWRNIIDIAPLPGQEPLILDPGDRLTFPELFHRRRTFIFPGEP